MAILATGITATPDGVRAQTPSGSQLTVQQLSERSSVIVRGVVLATNASDEPLLQATESTVVIQVRQMYAGREISGAQAGRRATVILRRPGTLRRGDEAMFFGNVRFLGRTMTIADEGEQKVSPKDTSMLRAVQVGALARSNRPIMDRLAAAALVFRGTVESVRPLDDGAQGKRETPRTEHDPEWQVANVRIVTPLRGGERNQVVALVFAGSRDITWFNSPKLRVGEDAIFLPHVPNQSEEAMLRASPLRALMDKQRIYLLTEPYDVLPPTDEGRMRSLITGTKEK